MIFHSETSRSRECICKMAARWGAGEETLTACSIDFFSMDRLDETAVLSSGETLEALQSCLDPSILSIFEDTPTTETKGLNEESEATLLTALTEILDNVDDENLSPFDTLPDSDLLSSQKGREHSPLRRLLCLSQSPPKKDTLCSTRPISTGKSLPRVQADSHQRSDGEEEEDGSLCLSPVRHVSSADSDLLDWEGLTLPFPVTFEQEGENGVSVSLGDLVRHMHPYCMAICVENEDGEQMLSDGGILLEVVDQAENGDPILAISDMGLPGSLPPQEQSLENEQKVSDEAQDVISDSSEHIVVDDEDATVRDAPVKVRAPATPDLCSDMKEMITQGQKEEIRAKSPSRRKKKKKSKEQCQPEPLKEGRVLRSGTVRRTAQEESQKTEKKSVKEEKKQKVPKVPLPSNKASVSVKPEKLSQTETQIENASTTLLPKMSMQAAPSVSPKKDTAPSKASPEESQPSYSATAVSSQQLDTTPENLEDSPAASSAVQPQLSSESTAAAPDPITIQVTPPVNEALPPVAPAVPEPKPKALSLEEYRRLRQQKKPVTVEKQDSHTTKWPSLSELPRELPPIPCLPDPRIRARRPNPQAAKKEVEEVKPAWQPRGPAAPPTPEALLVPPSYMVASTRKVSAATTAPNLQARPEPSALQKPSEPASNSLKSLPIDQNTDAQPAEPSLPQLTASPASSKHVCQFMSSADGNCYVLSDGKSRDDQSPQSQSVHPKSVELTKTCLKTTTGVITPTTATMYTSNLPKKTTVVSQKMPEVAAATLSANPSTSDRPSKPTSNRTQLQTSLVSHFSKSQSQTAEPAVLVTEDKPTTAVMPQRAKSPTQELIEAFTSEIGIEAADLTSLLEQFEETQAKEELSVPEVSGRAAAVGNSSFELAPEKTLLERVRANDLSSTAALTPPATPPHQMWKPLAPVALLGKSKATEASKSSPSKVIQIEAQPLPFVRSRCKPTLAAATVAPDLACMDHDYCLPSKGTSTGEPGKRWNVKQQSFITIKPIKQPATTSTPPAAQPSSAQFTTSPAVTTKAEAFPLAELLDHRTDRMERSSVLETPDASPARQATDHTVKGGSPRRGLSGRSYHQHAPSLSPSPRSSPKERTGGRSRKRSHRSHSPSSSESDSHSSRSRSRSHSPVRKRYRPRHSESSSSSSSRSSSRSSPSASRSPPRRRRYSYSSSHSGSWSRSRSRSPSPLRQAQWNRSKRLYSPSYKFGYGHSAKMNVEEVKRCKEKAIEERRVVYVGRIRGTMTQKELRERFSSFGEIEDCTLHFRDRGFK
ncbi:peroxisome proliferator-activated receptor gamma coactivator-related protein 1 isoform X2 [Mastacembelus armatus]|uniref:peroxisome proliferator-activated receptor gamma coactivator-related protein 1 isoform X2 n=1 Tax=Mastacembelus armatus TaxID=205130 RepID=UPI000E462065|nr:peroxisome proliferator-activated receptor gamma coactivator-related protein 1 isoform X2 [Mastacembelus armatus]